MPVIFIIKLGTITLPSVHGSDSCVLALLVLRQGLDPVYLSLGVSRTVLMVQSFLFRS